MIEETTYTIGDLAREFGITPRAIRFYEDEGLLAPVRAGRNRIYNKRHRTRLGLILRGKRLGLSLAEIKELIGMYDTARDESSQLAAFLGVLAGRRAALLRQREDIDAVLAEIDGFERQCRDLLADAGTAEEGSPAQEAA